MRLKWQIHAANLALWIGVTSSSAASLLYLTASPAPAKCSQQEVIADREYGPVVTISPHLPPTLSEEARVALVRLTLQRTITSLRDRNAAATVGYALDWGHAEGSYVYVPYAPRMGGVLLTPDRHFDLSRPPQLIYSRPLSDPKSRLIGARFMARGGSTFEQLDEQIPLDLARWKRTEYQCRAPGLPGWVVDVFPFSKQQIIQQHM